MKSKILKSLLVFILLICLGASYKLVINKNTQDYSKIAAQQFTDDNAIYELKTQNSAVDIINVIYFFSVIAASSLFYFIWKPKKLVKLDNIMEDGSTETKETDIKEDDTKEV